ncbi:MAG: hypothetical protein ACI8XO_000527 [Verrucomicrobiales bacterium]|jgi:hypothetical protein
MFVAQMELGDSIFVSSVAFLLGTSDQEAAISVDAYINGMGFGRLPSRGFYEWNSDLRACQ